MEEMNQKYFMSRQWWESLLINEMKDLTAKYYPNLNWATVNIVPSLFHDIFIGEVQDKINEAASPNDLVGKSVIVTPYEDSMYSCYKGDVVGIVDNVFKVADASGYVYDADESQLTFLE